MFSSPAIRPFSEENTSSRSNLKGKNDQLLSARKPLGDRRVNDCFTPSNKNVLKPKLQFAKDEVILQKNDMEEDLNNYDYRPIKAYTDDYEDIPKFNSFRGAEIFDILRSFSGKKDCKTPPPKFLDNGYNFILTPIKTMVDNFNDSANFSMEMEEFNFDDVPLPETEIF